MGWNGSGGAAATPKAPVKKGGAKPNFGKGIISGLVVCVLALGVLYFMRDAEKPAAKKAEKKPAKIAEVTPAVAPTNTVAAVPAKKKYDVEIRKLPHGEIMKYINGKQAWAYPHQDPAVYGAATTHLDRAKLTIEERIFPNVVDRDIAYLLSYEPGDEFGELPTKGFTQRFLKSLKDPIIVSHTDTEEEKALKRAVNEAKIELKARYDAGEDIEHIIEDTVKTYQDLGQYRAEVDKEIVKLSRDPAVTKEEMQQFIDAANEMLQKKGIRSAKVTGIIWNRIERNKRKMQFKNTKK